MTSDTIITRLLSLNTRIEDVLHTMYHTRSKLVICDYKAMIIIQITTTLTINMTVCKMFMQITLLMTITVSYRKERDKKRIHKTKGKRIHNPRAQHNKNGSNNSIMSSNPITFKSESTRTEVR